MCKSLESNITNYTAKENVILLLIVFEVILYNSIFYSLILKFISCC